MRSDVIEHGPARRTDIAPERRRGACRRRPLLQVEWRWILGGRRRSVRRTRDAVGAHTDWYPAWLLLIAMGTLLLSTIDAALTLLMLGQGIVSEANPLMARLLEFDPRIFINVKIALTGISLIFLVIFSRFSLFGAISINSVLCAVFGFYVLLVGYEVACGLAFGAFDGLTYSS